MLRLSCRPYYSCPKNSIGFDLELQIILMTLEPLYLYDVRIHLKETADYLKNKKGFEKLSKPFLLLLLLILFNQNLMTFSLAVNIYAKDINTQRQRRNIELGCVIFNGGSSFQITGYII